MIPGGSIPDTAAGRVVGRLFDAIEARDAVAITEVLAPDASWRNVPHPVAEGRRAVLAMLGPILAMSDNVEWEVVTGADTGDGVVLLERVDHFTIAGQRYGVPCNGAFLVDLHQGVDGGVVTEVRDYTDLGVWRERIGPVYSAWAARPATDVVSRHLAAVERRDPVAMAADYAPEAVLTRAGEKHHGVAAIRAYFDSVPERLGAATLTLGPPVDDGDGVVTVGWAIDDETGSSVAAGTDRYRIEAGWIVSQNVELTGADF